MASKPKSTQLIEKLRAFLNIINLLHHRAVLRIQCRFNRSISVQRMFLYDQKGLRHFHRYVGLIIDPNIIQFPQ